MTCTLVSTVGAICTILASTFLEAYAQAIAICHLALALVSTVLELLATSASFGLVLAEFPLGSAKLTLRLLLAKLSLAAAAWRSSAATSCSPQHPNWSRWRDRG